MDDGRKPGLLREEAEGRLDLWRDSYPDDNSQITPDGYRWCIHQLTGLGYPTIRAREAQRRIFADWGLPC